MNLHVLAHLLIVIFLAVIAFVLLITASFWIICRTIHVTRVKQMVVSLEERSVYIRNSISEIKEEFREQVKQELIGKDTFTEEIKDEGKV